MPRFLSLTILITVFSFSGIAQTADPNMGIIPASRSIQTQAGQFVFSREYAIVFDNPDDQKIAQLFHDYLKEVHFLDIPVAKDFVQTFDSTSELDRIKNATEKGITTALNLSLFRNKDRIYGAIFDGYILVVEQDGEVWIDGQLVVNNDGRHTSFQLTGRLASLKDTIRYKLNIFRAEVSWV